MLALKPNCQCCDTNIPADSGTAFICTFECTYCAPCALGRLEGTCPACMGNLTPRPLRPANKIVQFPAQTERAAVHKACLANPTT